MSLQWVCVTARSHLVFSLCVCDCVYIWVFSVCVCVTACHYVFSVYVCVCVIYEAVCSIPLVSSGSCVHTSSVSAVSYTSVHLSLPILLFFLSLSLALFSVHMVHAVR